MADARWLFSLLLGLFLIGPAAAQSPDAAYAYQNITSDTTTTIKTRPGYLHSVASTRQRRLAQSRITILELDRAPRLERSLASRA
jgi:adenylate kinase